MHSCLCSMYFPAVFCTTFFIHISMFWLSAVFRKRHFSFYLQSDLTSNPSDHLCQKHWGTSTEMSCAILLTHLKNHCNYKHSILYRKDLEWHFKKRLTACSLQRVLEDCSKCRPRPSLCRDHNTVGQILAGAAMNIQWEKKK